MRAALLSLLLVLPFGGLIHSRALAQQADQPKQPLTGPETEKRFPPLKVPPGFRATLFACDPLIEYPSVMSAGPRPGAVFVAVDYMTGLGTEITRRSEVRLVEDTNGDGYADKATLYAGGFNSIMGLCYHDGTVFVMHAPFLTALRDTKGTGVADERKDIVTGLGLTPEENPVRLHCANGVTAGHDGWLYLALGDHGCIVNRPEGDKLVLEGGGILRCRPDGRDLHIFSTGLRNIYDVALDAELNVFVRDNENDGGDYKIRVCHSFFGADHGYPYLYYERPKEALSPLADMGLGSSAGGVCYLEREFPLKYRGNLFFCEWGKSLVRYELRREGSSFAPPKEFEFATGAETDPFGFKPTDVVLQRDGSLMISDYADGQRPKRRRGRIYHIEYVGDGRIYEFERPASPIDRLNSSSYLERCEAQGEIERAGREGLRMLAEALASDKLTIKGRLHAIWIRAHLEQGDAVESLLRIATTDPSVSVRAQAVRAIADLADPVLIKHRLDAGPGDADLAVRLTEIDGRRRDDSVRLEILIALGRLRWRGTPAWLPMHALGNVTLQHAAMQSLRRTQNWPAVLKLLDEPAELQQRRTFVLQVLAGQYENKFVDAVIERMLKEKDQTVQAEYADALTRIYKKPAPWVYWDYRPKPRPPNTIAWERTVAIESVLNYHLKSADESVRIPILKNMLREKIPVRLDSLATWLKEDWRDDSTGLLNALRDYPPQEIRPHLAAVIRDSAQKEANRLLAAEIFCQGLDGDSSAELLDLAKSLGDGPILAELLRHSARIAKVAAIPLLQSKLASEQAQMRAIAIQQLGELKAAEGRAALLSLLADGDPRVRRAAANAAGKLEEKGAIETLLKLADDADPLVRAASLNSLLIFKEPRALPMAEAAYRDAATQEIALEYVRAMGGPEQSTALIALTRQSPSSTVLTSAVQTLTAWRGRPEISVYRQSVLDQAVADIQGASGSVLRWSSNSQFQFATGNEGRVKLPAKAANEDYYLATTIIFVTEATTVEFLASSSGRLEILLNQGLIGNRDKQQEFRLDSDRFTATLAAGVNRLTVRVGPSPANPGEFHLRFRRKSATEAHEKLIAAALSRGGNIEQGKQVFLNTEKSLCLKCHRVGDKGDRIGPELSGLGNRFSRIYIAESILDPNRTIAPSFGTLVVRLDSGQVLSGIKIVETENFLTLVDNQAQKHVFNKTEIAEQKTSPLSTMPEGLEKKLSENEFVDLVAYLASLKEIKP